jgi:thioredoxin-related protein
MIKRKVEIYLITKFVNNQGIGLQRMKKILIAATALIGVMMITSMTLIGQSGATEEGPVKWITFEEAMEKSKKDKRPIFIDVYTDWCGWCKVMDKNTFSDPKVAQLLNEKFYAVKFNGEQKEDVVFNGTTFKFVASGRNGYHQLAAALLNNQLSYPTVVFLDEEFKMIQPLPGYRQAPEFHKIAQYIGEGHYKSVKWEDWQTKYKSPF